MRVKEIHAGCLSNFGSCGESIKQYKKAIFSLELVSNP